MSDFEEGRIAAKASVYMHWATNPVEAERTAIQVTGKSTLVTYNDVERDFGIEAANAWENVIRMKRLYFSLIADQKKEREKAAMDAQLNPLTIIMNEIRLIADEPSRNGKQEILRRMAQKDIGRWVIEQTYNPFITYGIKCPLPNKCDVKPGEVTISYDKPVPMLKGDIEGLLHDLATRELTGTMAKEDLLHTMRSVDQDGKELLWRIISKDFKAGIAESSIHLVCPGLIPSFAVMRAQAFEPRHVKEWPWNAEWKLDGQRNTFVCKDAVGAFYTRSGRHVPALDFFVPGLLKVAKIAANDAEMKKVLIDEDGKLSFALDGEAMMGLFEETGALRRKGVDAIGSEFHCYDIMPYKDFDEPGEHGEPQKVRRKNVERFANIARQVLKHTDEAGMIQVVPMEVLNSEDEVFDMFERSQDTTLASYLARGDEQRQAELEKSTIDKNTGKPKILEGVMVKNPEAKYQKKKSRDWLKVKAEETEDLRIIGAYPGKPGTKYENSLGGVVVDFNGVHVRCGGGFSDPERDALWADFIADSKTFMTWQKYEKDALIFEHEMLADAEFLLINRLLEVAYHEVTPDLSLRHPRAVRFRDDKDSEIEK